MLLVRRSSVYATQRRQISARKNKRQRQIRRPWIYFNKGLIRFLKLDPIILFVHGWAPGGGTHYMKVTTYICSAISTPFFQVCGKFV